MCVGTDQVLTRDKFDRLDELCITGNIGKGYMSGLIAIFSCTVSFDENGEVTAVKVE